MNQQVNSNTCDKCDKSFTTERGLKIHIGMKHKQSKNVQVLKETPVIVQQIIEKPIIECTICYEEVNIKLPRDFACDNSSNHIVCNACYEKLQIEAVNNDDVCIQCPICRQELDIEVCLDKYRFYVIYQMLQFISQTTPKWKDIVRIIYNVYQYQKDPQYSFNMNAYLKLLKTKTLDQICQQYLGTTIYTINDKGVYLMLYRDSDREIYEYIMEQIDDFLIMNGRE